MQVQEAAAQERIAELQASFEQQMAIVRQEQGAATVGTLRSFGCWLSEALASYARQAHDSNAGLEAFQSISSQLIDMYCQRQHAPSSSDADATRALALIRKLLDLCQENKAAGAEAAKASTSGLADGEQNVEQVAKLQRELHNAQGTVRRMQAEQAEQQQDWDQERQHLEQAAATARASTHEPASTSAAHSMVRAAWNLSCCQRSFLHALHPH